MEPDKEIQQQLDVFAKYLHNSGLKMTRQRESIVSSFLRCEGHLSADELHEVVKSQDAGVGLATVFRTLKTMTDCGLAREIDLGDGRTRFEHHYKRPHHHHLVCEKCHRAIEFFSPDFEQLQDGIVEKYNFRPVRHRLQIFGICEACQNEEGQVEQPAVESDLVFARDALRIAMETEKRGVNFYKIAATIVGHESTRDTFLEMLADEEDHLGGIQKEWDRLIAHRTDVLEAPEFLHFDYEALKRIFPSRAEIKRRLKENLSELEALKLAMRMELDAYNFFHEYAEKFNDTRGRDIFLKFADEEQEHYDRIKAHYDRLVRPEPGAPALG